MSFRRLRHILPASLTACCLAALLTGLAPAAPRAAEVDLPVIGNASLLDSNADGVYESVASSSQIIVWWRNVNFLDQRFAYRAAIEFDLAALPADTEISAATLTITPTKSGGAPGRAFEFFGYAADGVLAVDDADAGEVLIETREISSLADVDIDVTAYLRELVDAGDPRLGINIRSEDEGDRSNSFDEELRSNGFRTTSVISPGPSLTVTYTQASPARPVPLPVPAMLLIGATVLVIGIKRSRSTPRQP
ncbi:MAG: hypothetical protein HKO62_00835 [Gammaproteobacteria bacterium]|nr:hypothetical protein [Gammaproteobacteria bacterium]